MEQSQSQQQHNISSVQLENLNANSVPVMSLAGHKSQAKVVEVYDGDTLTVIFMHSGQFQKAKIRIVGIDTPELHPRHDVPNRDEIIKAAQKARTRLITLTTNCKDIILDTASTDEIKSIVSKNTRPIYVEFKGKDKYGRELADIVLAEGSSFPGAYSQRITVSSILISEGLALPYEGGTKPSHLV